MQVNPQLVYKAVENQRNGILNELAMMQALNESLTALNTEQEKQIAELKQQIKTLKAKNKKSTIRRHVR